MFSVLAVGLTFGFLKVEPIPAILIAQAFNGLILPLVTVFLINVVNDPEIIGEDHLNNWISNILMSIVLWVTLILGFTNISKSISDALGYSMEGTDPKLIIPVIILSFFISAFVLWKIFKRRIKLVEQRL
jgi:Mn2+/Fe2+ NRAMP family transporter